MRRSGSRPYLSMTLVAGLLAILALLAVLQNRWIAQVSEAERERLESSLEAASTQLCDGFDRELTRAFQAFQLAEAPRDGELAGVLAARLHRWRTVAPDPSLVQELLVVTRMGGDTVTLSRLDDSNGRLVPADWDSDLGSLRRSFTSRGPVPVLDEALPGLVLPIRLPPPPEGREPRDAVDRRPPRDHVIVRLDLRFIQDRLLPRLATTLFSGDDGLAYSVKVTVAGHARDVIFAAGPTLGGDARSHPDLSRPLFSLRFFPELVGVGGLDRPAAAPALRQTTAYGRESPRPPPLREDDRGGVRDRPREVGAFQPPAGAEVGRWVLEVRHPAGSLETVVASARRRNLAISLAIVALLGAVGVLIVVSTRRAQRLARQQMDFVASVSHELRTPLTAIRSAGQNLADGIVDDPERVRKYGALVEREGRRLTEMVTRVLTFAGMHSGQPRFAMQPLAVGPLIEGVLSDSRWVLEERRFQVEASIADDLPVVLGDAPALRQAVSNLVDNAMKYGAAARWIGVSARVVASPRGDEVVIAVSDRGPGIQRSDLARIFEPFFRASDARGTVTPGSGLGLAVVRSIVEAHGGKVTVDSAPGRGSSFTIHLSTAAAGTTEESA